MKKNQVIEMIKSEIEWCKNNPQNMPEDWRNGFIEGMKQVQRLVKTSRWNI